MKQVKTRIKEFYKEFTSTQQFYTDNGVWIGDLMNKMNSEFQEDWFDLDRKMK